MPLASTLARRSSSPSPLAKNAGVTQASTTRGNSTPASTSRRFSPARSTVAALACSLDGPRGIGTEVLLHELQRRLRLDVSRHDERRVVRDVPGSEKLLYVVELGAIQVLRRADGQVVIRVLRREEGLVQVHPDHPVRRVLVVLAALVLDHVALARERLLVDVVEEEAHAIALEPQRELEPIRGDGLEVVGPVFGGGPVHVRGARALEVPDVRVLRRRACSPGTSRARRGGRSRSGRAPRPWSRRGTRHSPPRSASGDPRGALPRGRSRGASWTLAA